MMNKKLAVAVLAFAVCGSSFVCVPKVDAADVQPTTQVTKRAQGQSMILSMQEVAAIFTQKYPNSAVHSITLKPENNKFAYIIEGYTLKETYKIQVDCITGKVIKEEKSGKERNLAYKIFNPTQVVSPQVAQAAAVAAVGEGAIPKGWELEADKGIVTYEVDVIQANHKIEVTLNAKDGSVMAQSAPESLDGSDKDNKKKKK